MLLGGKNSKNCSEYFSDSKKEEKKWEWFSSENRFKRKKIIFHDIAFIVNLVAKKLEYVFLNNSLNNIIYNNMERKNNKQKSTQRRLIHISR